MAKKSFKIGLWGTPKAGKTTYLAVLYQEFLARSDEWNIRAEEEARRFIEEARRAVFENRSFLTKTVQTARYQYIITRLNDQRTFVLEFEDAAGELYEAYYERDQRINKEIPVDQDATGPRIADRTPQELFDYLTTCDGLLIFLDPGWKNRTGRLSQSQLLYQLFEDLRDYRKAHHQVAPRIALCLTKVDADTRLWERRHIDHRQCFWHNANSDKAYCASQCPVYAHLGTQFMERELPGLVAKENVACFALSAVGRYRQDGSSPENGAGWKLNVSIKRGWRRSPTPLPRSLTEALTAHDPPSLFSLNDVDDPEPLCEPLSINDPEKITPFNLLEPITWMLQ
jgi:hypothetical protein